MGKPLYEQELAAFRRRRQRALKLREKGKTYREIAAALGVSRARAEKLVEKARAELAR